MNDQGNSSSGSGKYSDFEQFAHESLDFMLQVGRELGRAAEDVTGLMLIRADKPLRARLDMLVGSGAAKTRYQALELLIKAGEVQKSRVFEQIEKTRSEIAALKKGLKDLVAG